MLVRNLLLKTLFKTVKNGFGSVKTDLADRGGWVEVFALLLQNFDFLLDDLNLVSQDVLAFALELFDDSRGFALELASVLQEILLGGIGKSDSGQSEGTDSISEEF